MTRCMIGISTAAAAITATIHRVCTVISLWTPAISLPRSARTLAISLPRSARTPAIFWSRSARTPGDLLAQSGLYASDLLTYFSDLLARALLRFRDVTEKPFLQDLEQVLFLDFATIFLIVFELAQHLHQRRGGSVPKTFLQRARHRKYRHGSRPMLRQPSIIVHYDPIAVESYGLE